MTVKKREQLLLAGSSCNVARGSAKRAGVCEEEGSRSGWGGVDQQCQKLLLMPKDVAAPPPLTLCYCCLIRA